MKIRQFNKICKELSDKKTGLFDINKIKEMDPDLKKEFMHYLVRHRKPIIIEFITPDEMSWLSSMGYLYLEEGEYFNFLCTSENQNKIIKKLTN